MGCAQKKARILADEHAQGRIDFAPFGK